MTAQPRIQDVAVGVATCLARCENRRGELAATQRNTLIRMPAL